MSDIVENTEAPSEVFEDTESKGAEEVDAAVEVEAVSENLTEENCKHTRENQLVNYKVPRLRESDQWVQGIVCGVSTASPIAFLLVVSENGKKKTIPCARF
ncbi:hypothetical protein HHI36_008445 [Cryptolaemus montrouzieri]|uniref:Uncharacterized protein n=1 Tax=Cryptolaemus montrouzieri TaxID=559131 RepID=A0ABD2MT01_9CUCU